jgi:hypothetical protein
MCVGLDSVWFTFDQTTPKRFGNFGRAGFSNADATPQGI